LLILITFLPAVTRAVTWPSLSSCFTGASWEFRNLTNSVSSSVACWSFNLFHLNFISGVWIQSVCWNRTGNVYTVYVSCLACLLCSSPYYPWQLSIRALSRHFVFLSSTVLWSFWFCLISSTCLINHAVPWQNIVFPEHISYMVRYTTSVTSVVTMRRCV